MEGSSSVRDPRTGRPRRWILPLLVIGSLLAGGVIGFMWNGPSNPDQVTGLQNQVNGLENQVISLEASQNSSYKMVQENVTLSQLYSSVKDSVVVITDTMMESTVFGQESVQAQGSGFVYNFIGRMVVVTNNHVIADATNISVTFSDGNGYPASVLGSDPYSDLAILSVNAPTAEFKPLQITGSSTLQVGDFVAAVGSPFGLAGSMTSGIVSQLGRTITETASGNYPIADVIQTSTAINSGNSGGPLLNDKGQVVGITTAVVSNSQGLGFAIPSNSITREIVSLVNNGSYNQHPWLGIGTADMSYDISKVTGSNVTYGVLIEQVTSGGPADNAGMKAGTDQVAIDGSQVIVGGDVVIAIDGHRIIGSEEFSTYIEENTRPNQTIDLTVIRDNQALHLHVLLGVRPSATG
jgi:S1-C subfamily serine protease